MPSAVSEPRGTLQISPEFPVSNFYHDNLPWVQRKANSWPPEGQGGKIPSLAVADGRKYDGNSGFSASKDSGTRHVPTSLGESIATSWRTVLAAWHPVGDMTWVTVRVLTHRNQQTLPVNVPLLPLTPRAGERLSAHHPARLFSLPIPASVACNYSPHTTHPTQVFLK